MGNNTSSPSRSGGHLNSGSDATSSSPSPLSPTQQSSSSSKARKLLIHPHHRSGAAPPKQSLAQAQGSHAGRPRPNPPTSPSSSYSPQRQQPQHAIPSIHDAVPTSSASYPPDLNTNVHDNQHPPSPFTPTQPVDVPSSASPGHRPHSPQPHRFQHHPDPATASQSSLVDAGYNRPPRLPLPIDEELHTPGSPIMAGAPLQTTADIEPLDIGSSGSNSSTAVAGASGGASSANTTEEDDVEDELPIDPTRPTVPYQVDWLEGGEKVYVTGTIFNWNRKQRLQPVQDGPPGEFSTVIDALPGTHHIRFLVDGIMTTSTKLPTTVDFGNNLVNYIEVSPPEQATPGNTTDGGSVDRPVESGVDTTIEPVGTSHVATTTSSETQPSTPHSLQPPPPPQDLTSSATAAPTTSHPAKAPAPRRVISVRQEDYVHDLPQYLADFDQAEDTSEYRHAWSAIERLPSPPSLPGFLSKPILNVAAPYKDDNSVLVIPNHTVLNHLATSSIKNNTLAVSATTRYHNKYFTTIIYKPTEV